LSHIALVAMFRRTMFLLATLLIGDLGVPTCILAHPSTSSAIVAAPPASNAIPTVSITESVPTTSPLQQGTRFVVLLIVGIAISLLLAGRRGRRRQILQIAGLALLLIATGFEGAIHSVHHLGDPSAAERCLVASSSQHLTVVDFQGPDVVGPVLPASEAVLPAQPTRTSTVWLASDAGRSPPA
jgi:hypothetical protein